MLKKIIVGSLLLMCSFSAMSQKSESAKFTHLQLVKKSYFDKVKDLSTIKIENEKLGLANTTDYSGRVNGFRFILMSKGVHTTQYNYGNVFDARVVGLISSSKIGDSILIDNITYTDTATIKGTTKSAKPLTFKIVE